MNRYLPVTTVAFCMLSLPLVAASEDNVAQRLEESSAVLQEIMNAPDKSIPQDLVDKSKCVVVVPNLKKGAFIVGAKYGKGFITCRTHAGWSAPGAVRIEGGSVGFQIGGSDSDVVLLVMNDRGAEKLLQSKFTLGGEGEVAAGPVGRDAQAQTDAKMAAEIYSWSRTRGLFAGVSLQGATLREDLDDNAALYGKKLSNREIVNSDMAPPKSADRLIDTLSRKSPGRKAENR